MLKFRTVIYPPDEEEGVPVEVDYVYEPGYPLTSSEPGERESTEIIKVRRIDQPGHPEYYPNDDDMKQLTREDEHAVVAMKRECEEDRAEMRSMLEMNGRINSTQSSRP